MTLAKPIIKKIVDNEISLRDFELIDLRKESMETQRIIGKFPTVYIHNWKDTDKYDVYVGESNDIFQRTKQHYETARKESDSWQNKMLSQDGVLYVIGHEHFNKSLTLDIENRLIQYMSTVGEVRKIHNARGNPQNKYYPEEELDTLFSRIWQGLGSFDSQLFPSESIIKDSALFKASPLHKLTMEQDEARKIMLDKIRKALELNKREQLIFVEGEAGTGKSVLNSSVFYELFYDNDGKASGIQAALIVNHDEQITVYKQIASKLGLSDHGEVIYKPTTFINAHSDLEPIDVAFVDEAHLLLTQGKQSYRGKNQLDDILKRARVTIVMFDENQILTTEQYWESVILESYRNRARSSGNYIILKNQLRMRADPETIAWIDEFTKNRNLLKIPANNIGYEIRLFNTPKELDDAICEKARDPATRLSRLIATYDWQYSSGKAMANRVGKYWEVMIEKWHKPWNYELERDMSRKEKRSIKHLAWAEQPNTIGEVGSTFTIQGFDLNYAGVILGPSVKYRKGRIVLDPQSSYNLKATRNRTLSDGSKAKFGEQLLQHEVRVLMTRGINGIYLYACDEELREALKKASL